MKAEMFDVSVEKKFEDAVFNLLGLIFFFFFYWNDVKWQVYSVKSHLRWKFLGARSVGSLVLYSLSVCFSLLLGEFQTIAAALSAQVYLKILYKNIYRGSSGNSVIRTKKWFLNPIMIWGWSVKLCFELGIFGSCEGWNEEASEVRERERR